MKHIYWHGSSGYKGRLPKDKSKEYFEIYDIKVPVLEDHSLSTYWSEFPDVILPYILEKRGKKYQFSEIEGIMREGPYELNGAVSVQENDVVIDCGANIGLFSAIAARKGALVYAFEPDSDVVNNFLSKTAEMNGEIRICPFALSDYTGKGSFLSDFVNIGGGNIEASDRQSGIQVDVISIDDYVNNHGIKRVDFIKADIEGAERKMLAGAEMVLREFAPKLSICTYHLPDDRQVLEAIVRKANPAYHIEHAYAKMYCWIE